MAATMKVAKVLRVFEDGKKASTKAKDFLGVNLYDDNGQLILKVRKD